MGYEDIETIADEVRGRSLSVETRHKEQKMVELLKAFGDERYSTDLVDELTFIEPDID